ncbi:endonuclease [Bacillus phage Tomato]|nr:endonuclease [Bacillus phage Tomato]
MTYQLKYDPSAKVRECKKCGVVKDIESFDKTGTIRRDGSYGRKFTCRLCAEEAKKERSKRYYQNNKEHVLAKTEKWKRDNKERVNESRREWYYNNKDRVKVYHKKYMEEGNGKQKQREAVQRFRAKQKEGKQ